MTKNRRRLTWIAALGLLGLALVSAGVSRDAARSWSGTTAVVRYAASEVVAVASLGEGAAVPGRHARSFTARRVPPSAPAWALAARPVTLEPASVSARVACATVGRLPLAAAPQAPIRAPPAA